MLDQAQTAAFAAPASECDYDFAVVGAGIAGLNVLHAALDYLPQGARVLLVDQKDRPGGMWNTAYDYVRLHQPHPMFTVGNTPWGWDRPPSYLASRDEVQAHLSRALDQIAARCRLTCQYGTTASAVTEIAAPQGALAEVRLHPNGQPDRTTLLRAGRAILAEGLNYLPAKPLALSSSHVVSIIPQDLRAALRDHPAAPVVVVGGGKTGMDTVLAVLNEAPGRPVTLIDGPGTNFLNRTRLLPNGLGRWTGGALISRVFRDMALTFDGTNESALMDRFRARFSTAPQARAGVFLYGFQGEDERARILAGAQEIVSGYLADIRDGAESPHMVMRDGMLRPVKPGSLIVNCTGSFFRAEGWARPAPYLTPAGRVLTLNARGAIHFLTSVSSYFGTHLLFRDKLRGQGFYLMDHEALFRKNRNAWVGASAAQAYLTQVLAVQNLPLAVLDACWLDLDRWYPLPRRMAGLVRLKLTASRDIAHCQAILDKVARRFDIACGPIS